MTVIDVHGHWGPWFFAMDIGDVRENLRLMDQWGITLQIVSGSEAVTYDAPGGNAKLAAILDREPRLRGYVVANPNDPAATEADLRRHLDGDRFVGVKIHTGYSRREMTSPQMQETFALLNEHAATILIHTWGADVLDLGRLVDAHPRLRVVAGHMGAHRWDLAAEAARTRPRLYLEPSCSITDAHQVAHVASRVPPEQLLFGTDATLIDPAVSFGLVEDADLPPAIAEAMYWRNAARLFDLEGAIHAHTP